MEQIVTFFRQRLLVIFSNRKFGLEFADLRRIWKFRQITPEIYGIWQICAATVKMNLNFNFQKFANKEFLKKILLVTDGGQLKISVLEVDSGAKLYSSVNHDGQTIWVVWQDKTGQNILGQAFDEFLDPKDSEKVLVNTVAGNLKLYGNSSRISASIVEFDITYKETENGFEKTFIASFTKEGV